MSKQIKDYEVKIVKRSMRRRIMIEYNKPSLIWRTGYSLIIPQRKKSFCGLRGKDGHIPKRKKERPYILFKSNHKK